MSYDWQESSTVNRAVSPVGSSRQPLANMATPGLESSQECYPVNCHQHFSRKVVRRCFVLSHEMQFNCFWLGLFIRHVAQSYEYQRLHHARLLKLAHAGTLLLQRVTCRERIAARCRARRSHGARPDAPRPPQTTHQIPVRLGLSPGLCLSVSLSLPKSLPV